MNALVLVCSALLAVVGAACATGRVISGTPVSLPPPGTPPTPFVYGDGGTLLPPQGGPPTETLPPATPVTRPSSEELGQPPGTVDELTVWLAESWSLWADPADIRALLQSSGWQQSDDQMVTSGLDGDGRDEWLLTLCTVRAEDGACSTTAWGPLGDFWVVSDGGVVYRFADPANGAFAADFNDAPSVTGAGDMDGDGRPEVVVETTGCGAHTCFTSYRILSFRDGRLANLVQIPAALQAQGVTEPGMATATARLREATGDGLADLVLYGGLISSAGAGLQRAWTEVWGWNGAAVGLISTTYDPSNFRFHLLYDANDAFDRGEDDVAAALYNRVINDESLADAPGLLTGESSDASSRQFAAFRLALFNLRHSQSGEAEAWQGWLALNYPAAPLARAAQLLLEQWQAGQGLAAACTAVTGQLSVEANPTGSLSNMGYANPTLDASAVCPIR